MKSDIPNPLSEILQPENVTMPKVQKVKVHWFKSFKKIKTKKNESSSKNTSTNTMQGTSCSVPESGTSSTDSDVIIVFDSISDKIREKQQTVISADSGGDDILVDYVDTGNSSMQHNSGTSHCTLHNGSVGDICYADVRNNNSSKQSAKNIEAVEGTSKTISDPHKQTGRYVYWIILLG
jgi:hypothetical protein